MLREAKDLVFRNEMPLSPNNEILRRGAEGPEPLGSARALRLRRRAPQNDIFTGAL